jgi:hypothetical protein
MASASATTLLRENIGIAFAFDWIPVAPRQMPVPGYTSMAAATPGAKEDPTWPDGALAGQAQPA